MQEKVSVLAKKHSVDIVVGTLVENMKQASDHPSNPREQKTFNTLVVRSHPIFEVMSCDIGQLILHLTVCSQSILLWK